MVIITETWLSSPVSNDCIVPVGYTMFRWDRDSRGGGVAIVVKSSIRAALVDCTLRESVWCKITFKNLVYLIGAFYRPAATSPELLDELNNFLCDNVNESTRLLMAGDFNLPHINWEDLLPGNTEVLSGEKLLKILFSHNLTQIVKEATRITAETQSILDLVFLSSQLEEYTVTVEEGTSDHRLVVVNITTEKSGRPKSVSRVTVKNYAEADDTSILDFLEVAFNEFQSASENESVETLWNRFKTIVDTCVRRFVPSRL